VFGAGRARLYLEDGLNDRNAVAGERILRADVDEALAGHRLDQVLASLFDDYSRSRLQTWIKEGRVTVDGGVKRPRDRVSLGQRIELRATLDDQVPIQPQAIDLDIVYEDDALLVVDKPAGMVVHPAAGNPDGTLQNALLHHFPASAALPRAGIIHRLDKNTTGLMVVAKTTLAHKRLVVALQARDVEREYAAVATGVMVCGGTVNEPIGRHPAQRTKMAVVVSGKPAITHYRLLEGFRAHSFLQVNLETGRTHQIRVHMAYLRHPLVGDAVYGGRPKLPTGPLPDLVFALRNFGRQALHARKLSLLHPVDRRPMTWESPLPADMNDLLDVLRRDEQYERAT